MFCHMIMWCRYSLWGSQLWDPPPSWAVSWFCGLLTYISGSGCGLAGDSLLGLAGLLMEGVDIPEEDSLSLALYDEVEGIPWLPLCTAALLLGHWASPPFSCSLHGAAMNSNLNRGMPVDVLYLDFAKAI